ncbi:MAG: flagellar hook-associated protein FlgK [Tepidibacter sp.]|jgi:flagellar hook-associated protein 1 FlgK|uniref:flagellar hook-associated protein FlgK n=1 Tax=Tepidibacter sp. TaxID=2529387 RepID=UPI0025FA3F5F|nr:flagellar hook-associated protein FlgK [Tepidibacter sp.]MCT4509063.1 flagellar hook-associated protein FlgK [Tepidibacter sp.]
MSSFFGLNIAKSGLFAAQKSLNTVSHNIANANTRGYSRQRIELVSSNPLSAPNGSGMIGTGVDSKSVTQIRNEFLDVKFRGEVTSYGQWDYRRSSLEEIEAIMNEPGDSGITEVMNEFFSSFEELSKNSSSVSVRTVVRERAIAFTNSIRQMHSQFEKMLKDTDSSIESTVNQINGYARDISKLNEQIYQAEMGGSNANDLRDQRNVLLDDLSKLVDVEIDEVSQGNENLSKKMVIAINGQPLVSHNKVDTIIMQKKSHKHKDELGIEFDIRDIMFESGSPINTNNIKGTLKAQIDMRDNLNDVDGAKGIPYYIKKLDEFVNRFTAELDVQHFAGYGLDSAGTGNLFFKDRDISKDTTDSTKFTVNKKLGLNEIHDPSMRKPAEISGKSIDLKNNLSSINADTSITVTVDGVQYKISNANLKSLDGTKNEDDLKKILNDAVAVAPASGNLKDKADINIVDGKISIKSKVLGAASSIEITINGTDAASKTSVEDSIGLSTSGVVNGSNSPIAANSIKDYIQKQKEAGKTESEAIKEWEETYEGYTLAADDEGNWYEVEKLSAKDIQISSKIEKDVDYIAVAKKHDDNGEGISGDNSNIKAMSNLRHDDSMFTWGSPDDFVTSLVSNLGVESQEAKRMRDNQSVLVNQIDNTRQSISGVSIDEEMSNMIKFQHAYNASARMITAVDEMIDVIINRMGRVGM